MNKGETLSGESRHGPLFRTPSYKATKRLSLPVVSDAHQATVLEAFRPGAYTAQVSAVSGDTGLALVEVNEVL
jgi:hypothetical protein